MAKNQPRPWMRWAFPLVLAVAVFGAPGCAPGGDATVADVVDPRCDADEDGTIADSDLAALAQAFGTLIGGAK